MYVKDAFMNRRSQGERTESTRTALLQAARSLFEERGYAATGTPEIVTAANVTLFEAVAQQAAQEVADEIARQSRPHSEPVASLIAGVQAYFDAMAVPGRARLLLLEAPAVLGTEQVMALNDRAGFQSLLEGLRHALPGARQPLHELAVLLSAVFDRAALAIARGEPAAPYVKATRLLLTKLVA
jgi:AcrR family transcriptional regulator